MQNATAGNFTVLKKSAKFESSQQRWDARCQRQERWNARMWNDQHELKLIMGYWCACASTWETPMGQCTTKIPTCRICVPILGWGQRTRNSASVLHHKRAPTFGGARLRTCPTSAHNKGGTNKARKYTHSGFSPTSKMTGTKQHHM